MRKLFVAATLMLLSLGAMAQNVQLHYDFEREAFTTTVERFTPDDYGSTFFFIDMDYSDAGVTGAYWELARELKFWEGPISAHVEYNGGLLNSMSFENAYLLGATYSWNAEDFSKGFSLTASYKLIQNHINYAGEDAPHNFQLTGVWYMNFLDNKLSFTGFADLWSENTTVSDDGFTADFQEASYIFLSEPQLWWNFNETFSAGGELELSNNFGGTAGFKVRPTLAVKWTIN